jgi:hypothetical protein
MPGQWGVPSLLRGCQETRPRGGGCEQEPAVDRAGRTDGVCAGGAQHHAGRHSAGTVDNLKVLFSRVGVLSRAEFLALVHLLWWKGLL